MATLRLIAQITEEGELKVKLPPGLPPRKVEITLKLRQAESQPLTEEEVVELMKPRPASGAEIAESDVIGAWARH